jgi:type VI secretion system protein ImpC
MFPSDSSLEARFTFETEANPVDENTPFRILLLGDWSGQAEAVELQNRRPIEIDRDNFDEVLNRLKPQLVLDDSQTGENVLSLSFSELDDFHPDRIFERLSIFTELRDVRRRLQKADSFNAAAREVRSWFDQTENASEVDVQTVSKDSAPANDDNLLDQILSQKNSPSAVSKPNTAYSSALNSLLGDLVKPHLININENEQTELLAAVDRMTSDLMRRILHDHRFQSLESAWRGLYFLVRGTETDSDLKIFILDVKKQELSDNLKSVSSLGDTFLYELISPENNDINFQSWAVIGGNYAFNADVDDTATLIRLSRLAASANTPFVSHLRPDIFGVSSLAAEIDKADWNLSNDSEAVKLWTTLRSLPESEYLGLLIPRFLARLPYGSETEPLDNFDFEEFASQPIHDEYLWANPVFLCVYLLGLTFRKYGWNFSNGFIQDVENLPLHFYKIENETFAKPCAEVLLTHKACDSILEQGLMPLISFRNADYVRIARLQSISKPLKSLGGKWI